MVIGLSCFFLVSMWSLMARVIYLYIDIYLCAVSMKAEEFITSHMESRCGTWCSGAEVAHEQTSRTILEFA